MLLDRSSAVTVTLKKPLAASGLAALTTKCVATGRIDGKRVVLEEGGAKRVGDADREQSAVPVPVGVPLMAIGRSRRWRQTRRASSRAAGEVMAEACTSRCRRWR